MVFFARNMSLDGRTLHRFLGRDLIVAATSGVAVWLFSGVASGQPPRNFSVEKFEPAPAGDSLVVTPDADILEDWKLSAGLVVDYAHQPLVTVVRSDSDGRSEEGAVVSGLTAAHVLMRVSAFRRLRVHLDIPAALTRTGESPSWGNTTVSSPDGASWLDLKAGAGLALVHQRGNVPAVSVLGSVWVPSGDETQFGGVGAVSYSLGVAVGSSYERWLWRMTMGRRYAQKPDSSHGVVLGDSATWSVGAAYLLGDWQLGADVYGSTVVEPSGVAFSRRATNMEALASARWRTGPLRLTMGAGPGLASAPGTPQMRVLIGLEYTPFEQTAPPRETAQRASVARRRAEAEPSSEMVAQSSEPLPTSSANRAPGSSQLGEHAKNEPPEPDSDNDGIADIDDDCPKTPGVPSAVLGRHGCPRDQDGDGIADSADACPLDKGPRTRDPKTNGCPTKVSIQGQQVVVMQRIRFATGSDVLESSSIPVLEQVKDVLQAHPEIARVAVEGHTDNVGSVVSNLDLSRRRAVAVVRWLVEHGVDARRLEARGYGPKRPVASNDTDEGRAKNRRVSFVVLRRTSEGKRGWVSGQVRESKTPVNEGKQK